MFLCRNRKKVSTLRQMSWSFNVVSPRDFLFFRAWHCGVQPDQRKSNLKCLGENDIQNLVQKIIYNQKARLTHSNNVYTDFDEPISGCVYATVNGRVCDLWRNTATLQIHTVLQLHQPGHKPVSTMLVTPVS